jgi:hypothetical protein
VAKVSNRMAAFLSRQLDDLVRARSLRDRFQDIGRFLDKTAEGGSDQTPPDWRIDDDAVLNFWVEAATDPERDDLRLFQSVHRSFVALVVELSEGEAWRSMTAGAIEVGDALEIGLEIDAAQATLTVAPNDGPLGELLDLGEDGVKFINKSEGDTLGLVNGLWRCGPDFPLSVLRSAAMGRVQNTLVNALKFKRELEPTLSVVDAGAVLYKDAQQSWRDLLEHLRKMRMASAFVALSHRNIDPPEGAEEARRVYRGIRRQGFQDALEAPDRAPLFEAAIPPLSALSSLIEALLQALPADPADQFDQDARTFEAVFRTLYGQQESR